MDMTTPIQTAVIFSIIALIMAAITWAVDYFYGSIIAGAVALTMCTVIASFDLYQLCFSQWGNGDE